MHSITTPRRETFYWLAVVATFALVLVVLLALLVGQLGLSRSAGYDPDRQPVTHRLR